MTAIRDPDATQSPYRSQVDAIGAGYLAMARAIHRGNYTSARSAANALISAAQRLRADLPKEEI